MTGVQTCALPIWKSTFARKHFKPTEVLSSDECRGLVADDPNSQDATNDAFDVLRYIAGKRLARGLLTVIDATNVQEESRRPLVELAREHDVLPAAIVLKMREEICRERNRQRDDRDFGPHVVRNQCMQLRRSLRSLAKEGFRYVHVLESHEELEQVQIERQPLWNNRKWDHGPFDIIGDVHGCYELLEHHPRRREMVHQYVDAYRRYCWPVRSVADLRLAPFHLLASESKVHADRDHLWHMQTLARLAAPHTPLIATAYKLVDLADPASIDEGVAWWEELTARGGEGMVVKPLEFTVRSARGLVQPAVKCRGREYLRIIYGPEYTDPPNLQRLRSRGLAAKRSLALREFALGIEALERFVRCEPLRRVHECVFGVLALESEPVDPRL